MPRKKAKPIPPSKLELKYDKFGDVLREFIRAQGYTQAAFADAIGISYPYMMDILKGTRRVSLQVYLRILDVLGVTDLAMLSVFLSPQRIQHQPKVILELLPLLNELSDDSLEELLRISNRMAEHTSENQQDDL